MIAIGIDISKRKSTFAIINVMGEILQIPFEIEHSQSRLQKLWDLIKDYPKNQVRFMMEATGIYHLGLLNELQKQGYFVHVSNPLLKNILMLRFEKRKQIEKRRWNFLARELRNGGYYKSVLKLIELIKIYNFYLENIIR